MHIVLSLCLITLCELEGLGYMSTSCKHQMRLQIFIIQNSFQTFVFIYATSVDRILIQSGLHYVCERGFRRPGLPGLQRSRVCPWTSFPKDSVKKNKLFPLAFIIDNYCISVLLPSLATASLTSSFSVY